MLGRGELHQLGRWKGRSSDGTIAEHLRECWAARRHGECDDWGVVMGVFDTFSKRLKKRQRAGKADVFQYDDLPTEFRVQVVHILVDAIGYWRRPQRGDSAPVPNRWWDHIHSQMTREFGVFRLSEHGVNPSDECQYFIQEAETLAVLDLIEFAFRVVNGPIRRFGDQRPYRQDDSPTQTPDDAIEELNQRFLEHQIGYAFVDGQLIRKDSQFLHAEAVRPALALLSGAKFRGPSDEFLRGHEHYRHGRHKEAVQEALKAFESTMKAICDARGWRYKPTDTAKPLIDVLLKNDLIPPFLQAHLAAFATVLESGLPTVRNKLAGHGQGGTPIDVPGYFVAYALHLAATNIVMLVEAHNAKR